MTQRTLVLQLDPREQALLRQELKGAPLAYRTVPHALFSAKGEDFVVTLYRSGKLVVQGAGADVFAARYLGGRIGAPVPKPALPPPLSPDRPLIGGDESGKGDYFGPLVVAAVRLEPGETEKLRAGGIADSKKLSDSRVAQLAPALRASFPHALATLSPPEYNRLHAEVGNVSEILARLYRRVVGELSQPGSVVLVDQFSARPERLESAVADLGVELHQWPRAESEMAVAAASILARDAFLTGLHELSGELGVDLPKGAGPPVVRAARRFLTVHGPERLGEVAKLHFATTLGLGLGGAAR